MEEYLGRALTYLIAVLKHQPERCVLFFFFLFKIVRMNKSNRVFKRLDQKKTRAVIVLLPRMAARLLSRV